MQSKSLEWLLRNVRAPLACTSYRRRKGTGTGNGTLPVASVGMGNVAGYGGFEPPAQLVRVRWQIRLYR